MRGTGLRSLAAAILAFFALAIPAARADCAQDVTSLRARLTAIREPAKQQEADLLLTKAQKDNSAGRADLCAAAVKHAALLTK